MLSKIYYRRFEILVQTSHDLDKHRETWNGAISNNQWIWGIMPARCYWAAAIFHVTQIRGTTGWNKQLPYEVTKEEIFCTCVLLLFGFLRENFWNLFHQLLIYKEKGIVLMRSIFHLGCRILCCIGVISEKGRKWVTRPGKRFDLTNKPEFEIAPSGTS